MLEELNAYKREEEICEETLFEKEVAMKAMTPSLVDLERDINCSEIKKRLVTEKT